MSEAVRCVIVPWLEYEELVKRSLCAPKNLPPLTGKQKGKLHDRMANAAVVNVRREMHDQMPGPVQEIIQNTLH